MDYSKAVGILVIACFWASVGEVAGGEPAGKWPSKGLVAMWSGQGNAADSAGKNHGRASGGVKYAAGISGLAFNLDGKSAHINVGSPAGVQVTGDQTIAMWLKPERLGVRQNPIAKAYGGEMTITVEPDGRLNYFYGISGRNAEAFDAFTLPRSFVDAGKWTHIAVVRDFKARKLRWYINGEVKQARDAKFNKARASSLPLYIGKGHEENYCGLIDEVCIWNRAINASEVAAVVASVPLAAPVVPRGAKQDSIRLLDGSVLLGAVQNENWPITTSHGKFEIPAARVVGLASMVTLPAPASRPVTTDVRMLLTDGQVLVGALGESHVQLKLPNGQLLKVPVARIKQCGYRIAREKPACVGEVRKADKKFPATAVLRNGDHLAWESSDMKMRFDSVYGLLDLDPRILASIAPAGDNRWCVGLKGSSLILGSLAAGKLKLKLQLGKEITVPSRSVMYLTCPGAVAKPTNATTIVLSHGDRLVGTLSDKVLTVRTAEGKIHIPTADVWLAESQANGTAKLTMQNLTVLRCQLLDDNLDMVLASGFKFSVRTDRIVSITASQKLPADLIAKIEAIVKELGDPSEAKRKAAAQKLIAMGKGVLVVLKRHSKSKNPAIGNGVKEVIDMLEGKGMLLIWPENIGPKKIIRNEPDIIPD